MTLIEKTVFINSHSKELIVEIIICKYKFGYVILREKNASITGVIKITLIDAIEHYKTEVKETKFALQKMEVIYEIRN